MLTENGRNSVENSPIHIDMSNYPSILTPPSSSEDSPQSIYYNNDSPGSRADPNFILVQPMCGISYTNSTTAPYLQIIEQPIDRFRFRYKSEMTGTHGSLCGQTSDRSRKQTYPTVQLLNYDKPAIIRCSIYQHNALEDHRPHAHRLIKKQGKGEVDDPHDLTVSQEEGYIQTFHSMGIIHTAKKNLVPELVRKKTQLKEEEIARNEGKRRILTVKENIEIKGLAENESKSINLNVVCLRFDAFMQENGILYPLCPPVYSHGINNLKSALTGELKIVRMDHCTSPAKGNKEIFMLVERVTKKNIKIRFYEMDDDEQVVWEDYGKFSDLDVHHQYAIVFKTPPYKNPNITTPVKVFIELERPSDNQRSEPKEFTYTVPNNPYQIGAKRARPSYESSSFDSSIPSDELPLPINNLCLENNILDSADMMQVSSSDLQEAMNNINSEEFLQLFSTYKSDYVNCTTDSPTQYWKSGRVKRLASSTKKSPNSVKLPATIPQRRESIEEKIVAKKAIEELKNLIKTRPVEEEAISMLCHYLGQDNKTNALHISIRHSETSDIMFLLKMIYVYKQNELANMKSNEGETPLHIAVYNGLDEIVVNLLVCKADRALGDVNNNTPLHYAVLNNASTKIFEKLLSGADVKCFIDAENNDGNTALNLAIEQDNLRAVKLLCLNGTNINLQHKKSGYTPLRFAVEKQNLEIIRYILQHADLDPLIDDFQNANALQAALHTENPHIVDIITNFMQSNDYCDIEIKNEVDYYSDDEVEEKYAVKVEPVSSEELREMYSNVKDFTPECLNAVAEILDETGAWHNLADLLELGHLMRSGVCDSKTQGSPTKLLLKLAIETNGDTVLQIRDFLENLDETAAVEIIDNMVKSHLC